MFIAKVVIWSFIALFAAVVIKTLIEHISWQWTLRQDERRIHEMVDNRMPSEEIEREMRKMIYGEDEVGPE